MKYFYGDGYAFGPDDTLLTTQLQLISLATGEVVKSMRLYANADEECIVRSVAYDKEKELYLVAWSKYYSRNELSELNGEAYDAAFTEYAHITLDVFDSDFNFPHSCDTGVDVGLYDMYSINYIKIEPDVNGNASLIEQYSSKPFASVRYWD